MIFRSIGLYARYLRIKIQYVGKVKFNGFSVVYAFPKSKINFDQRGGIIVNSSPLSNLLGLCQRTIIIARGGGVVNIGRNCGVSGSTIYAHKRITIGDNTIIGANCKIIDSDFHPLNAGENGRLSNCSSKMIRKEEVLIGKNCFIGTNAIILKGTQLGNNVVVGAGSVVSGKFPDNVIIAGNPAKIIRENIGS